MKIVPLGDVASVKRRGVDPSALNRDTPYIGLEHIERGGEIIGCDSIGSAAITSTKFSFTPEDVLFGKLRPNLVKVARPTVSGVCSTDILPLQPSPRLDKNYLTYYLRRPDIVALATRRASGANLPRLSPQELLKFPIELPDFEEQVRIAAILDHVDGLRAKRRQILAHLEALTQSIFHDMFGDPATWSNRWTIDQIGSLAESVNYGTSSKAGQEGEWPILRMGNISPSGRISTTDLKYLDLPPNEVERFSVRPGDILFNRTNSPDLVGKTAVVRTEERFAYAGYLIRLRTNMRANPEFISGYLNSPHGKSTLRGMCKSIIGQANINAKELQSIRIAVPPRDLQDQWESVITMVEAKRNLLLKSESTADSLFQALQSRAFRAEL